MNTFKSLLCLMLLYQAQARYTDQHRLEDSTRCDDCINLISTLKDVLNSSSTDEEAEIKLNALDCSQFESAKRICNHLVTFNPKMLDIVIDGDDSVTICTNIRRCNPSRNILPSLLTPADTEDYTLVNDENLLEGSTICDDCINLISSLKDVLNKSSTDEEAEMKLNAIDCSQFVSAKRICDHLVTFNPTMLDIVIDGDDSVTICTNIKRCNPSVYVLQSLQKPADTEGNIPVTDEKQLEGSKRCDDCINLISTLNDVLNTSSTDEEAEMELNAIDCSQFGSVRGICEHLINLSPQMLDIIILGEDSRTICTNIRRCKSNFLSRPLQPIQTEDRDTHNHQFEEANICDDCTNLFTRLEQDLNSSSTVEDVQLELDSVLCSQRQTRTCKRAVRRLAPRVLMILSRGEDPTTICISMKRCQPSSYLKAVDPPTKKECKTCKSFIRDLMNKEEADILTNTATMKDQLCSRFSAEGGARCNETVDSFGQNLINDLESRNIQQTCINMELCPQP